MTTNRNGSQPAPARPIQDRLAVCTWSLRPASPDDLIRQLRTIGISRVQLDLDPLRDRPDTWSETGRLLSEAGVSIVSGMMRCVGEDYSTLESIRRTGGIAPDSTWEQNRRNFFAGADIASALGLGLVTFHAGFLPPETDPNLVQLCGRLALLAEHFASRNIALGLETGQETAPELASMLRRLGHQNLGVNFDPANMILYDKGDPVDALRLLAPWIRQVHLKDAKRTRIPGTWGKEVPVGSGDVDWPAFFETLTSTAPGADLVIERESGDHCIADIRTAREVALRYSH
ncbi:MAG: sugar phosphate isomerase/epimerase family protein [Verrucomicrobiota bacterium]